MHRTGKKQYIRKGLERSERKGREGLSVSHEEAELRRRACFCEEVVREVEGYSTGE